MKYIKVFVVAVLVISLFMNVRLLSRMENLENSVNNINHYQSQLMNSVNNQSSSIYNAMEEFKREQSWISPIHMDVDTENLEKGQTTLRFEWQIKELMKNSEVVFHYKYGEAGEEYSSVQAVEKESGLFEVSVPVEIILKPEWHVSVSTSGRNGNMAEETKREIEEKKMKEDDNSQLSYYVTVSTDDLLKSSQMNTTNISHLGMNYYGPLDIHIDIHEGGYYASVMAPPTYYTINVVLEEAYLLKYKDGKLVEEEKLVIRETNEDPNFKEMPIELHKQSTKEKFEYTSLSLKVVYSNGDVFEREVYSE